jgi:4-alpha-glucanotransferase
LGGYAAGTIAGTLTRRYHGLLVAPVKPPLGRHLVLAKADATLSAGSRSWHLFSNRWSGGAIDPHGYFNIESFELDGRMPVWRYACNELSIEHRIWMEYGEHTTYSAWRLVPGSIATQEPVRLTVRLLANAERLSRRRQAVGFQPDDRRARTRNSRSCIPTGSRCHLKARGGNIASRHDWFENFDLRRSASAVLSDRDSHLCVGEATLDLLPGEWVGITASLNASASVYLDEALRRARARDLGQLRRAQVQVPELIDAPSWVDQLILAADSFVFAGRCRKLPDGESIIAGYPWFGDWGRDTMIALSGLMLATGRYDTARRILQTFARFVDRGMLPNVFPGAGTTPEYNTVDAALWFIEAWRAYLEAIDDRASLREAFPVLQSIIDWHIKGTRYGIGMDENDALLRAGEPGVQLTWMDAKLGDWVVTPRIGKPVEINALWYNAVSSMAHLADLLKLPSKNYRELASRIALGFQRFIVGPDAGFVRCARRSGRQRCDVAAQSDLRSQPAAQSRSTRKHRRRLCMPVRATCSTSYGLRSLAPTHPEFRATIFRRRVGARQRLSPGPGLGFPCSVTTRSLSIACEAMLQGRRRALEPLRDHLLDAALGTVSEVFDGAPPHTPRGAPSQAWSVACALECVVAVGEGQAAAQRRHSGKRSASAEGAEDQSEKVSIA